MWIDRAAGMSGGGTAIFLLIYLAVIVFLVASVWKVFTKAGKPGWAALVPGYNVYIQLKIVGRPGWWLIWLFVPFVNFVVGIIIAIDLAKSFGKGSGFGVGLALLGFIFFPILGFGSARYIGPSVGGFALSTTGTLAPGTRFCAACGTPVTPDARFCPSCGQPTAQ